MCWDGQQTEEGGVGRSLLASSAKEGGAGASHSPYPPNLELVLLELLDLPTYTVCLARMPRTET